MRSTISRWISDAQYWLGAVIVSAYLIGGGIILSLIAGVAMMAWIGGRRSERAKGRDHALDVREKQLDAAVNAAKTDAEVIERLRKVGL